jgi:GntR family transcriptional regulator
VLPPPTINYRAELHPHEQIAKWIRDSIEAAELESGDVIPSEKEMSQVFGVARTTVRRAVKVMQREGLVYTIPQRGSYVA